MPHLRAGEWIYDQGEVEAQDKDVSVKAENKPGHRPLSSYALPKWVFHPDQPTRRIVVEKQDYFGMAADGSRNFENWNVAHVAALHDDLKLLSLATIEQCKEPNKWGMTPTHMCGIGQHPHGPSLNVLYELMSMGVADQEAVNHAGQQPWHICQRMHKVANLKQFEKVLLKNHKPNTYEKLKAAQLQRHGKFARPAAAMDALGNVGGQNVCLVFPGQGSQYVGMMQSLRDLPEVVDMLEKAQSILGYDILDVMLNGPEEELQRTAKCQPAMYIAGLAAYEQFKKEYPTEYASVGAVAGLSLGEYTALTVAGVFDFETGLQLVQERGNAMEYEVTREGAPNQQMISIAGLSAEVVQELCQEAIADKPDAVCQIANYLFPNGFSVAGSADAIDALEPKALDAGALQAKKLKTVGAFHTHMMSGAREHLVDKLEKVKDKMSPPKMEVYMNTMGSAIPPGKQVDEIIKLLGDQLVSPVRWEQSMLAAIEDGCTAFFECGPSKQLKSMMKRISPKMSDKMKNVTA